MNQNRSSSAKALFTATIGLAFGVTAVSVASFGSFILPLSRAFGWPRGDVSMAMVVANACNIVAFPIVGSLVDKYGLRKVLLPSIVLFGLALASLALMTGPIWQLYLGYALLAIGGSGTSTVTYTRLIVSWFTARRGMALGLALAGMGISVGLLPLLVQTITAAAGWRVAYLALGLLVIVGVLPHALPWARYPQDSLSKASAVPTPTVVAEPSGMTFRDAVRSKTFILMIASFSLVGILTGAIPTHLVPLLFEKGVPAMKAAALASSLGISLILGRLVMGYLIDRVFAPHLMIGVILIALVGLGMMLSGGSAVWLVVSISCMGFTVGADVDCLSYLISRYIGLRAYTRVYGILLSAFTLGVGIGPGLMGYSFNVSGGYDLALRMLIGATGLAIVPFLFFGRYPDEAPPVGGPEQPKEPGHQALLHR